MEFYYFTTVEEGDLVQISHHLLADSTVPTSNVSLAYMAEGAANVIWSVGGEATIKNKLLRIRKGTWSGDGDGPPEGAQCPPPFLSSSAVFAIHQSKILPLFEPGQLVEQELVHVDAGLVTQCNAQLDELERANLRPTERRHWHIKHEETYGLLITSMLPTSQKSALFHFKPKWLAQSPTAPPNARRCRTCALAARRGTDAERLICPLALYGGNEDMVRAQIEARVRGEATMSDDMIGRRPSITTERFMQANEMLKANVVEALIQDFTILFQSGQKAHKLLERLKELQLRYDPTGVLALPPGADTADLSMAMTLRDATMFVKITRDGADVRLGDLDPKSGDNADKIQQWRKTEQKLIEEGWYVGTETKTLRNGRAVHTSCFLWSE